jgi:hypothetical protein
MQPGLVGAFARLVLTHTRACADNFDDMNFNATVSFDHHRPHSSASNISENPDYDCGDTAPGMPLLADQVQQVHLAYDAMGSGVTHHSGREPAGREAIPIVQQPNSPTALVGVEHQAAATEAASYETEEPQEGPPRPAYSA